MDAFTEKRKEREDMHLHKLADILSFHEVAIGGTLPQTEYYREKLKRLHPMQMLSLNILLPLYEISFSYPEKFRLLLRKTGHCGLVF